MKRRRLGQHYLVDGEAINRLVSLAEIISSERVLEVGTGKGAVTRELVGKGASFEGYEIDGQNYEETLEAIRGVRAQIHNSDAFERSPKFDVLVSSLPYSESSRFIRWLSRLKFVRAVVVLQDDFVRKIMAPPGARDYRAVSAVAQIAFEAKVLDRIPRSSFSPPPRVDSMIVSFAPRRTMSEFEIGMVTKLFTLRKRQVGAALVELGLKTEKDYGRRRVYSLGADEVLELCRLQAA